MQKILALLAGALLTLPATAVEAPGGCAWLCGNWQLDADLGDAVEPLVDAALQNVKQTGPGRTARTPRNMELPQQQPAAEAGAAAAPPPARMALRAQLLEELEPPTSLTVDAEPGVILIRTASGELRRLFPGEPHTRVTSRGPIKITTRWKKEALLVRQEQGRESETTETFALLDDGNLQVTCVVERPGIKALTQHTVYRRGQTQELESGAPEPSQNKAP